MKKVLTIIMACGIINNALASGSPILTQGQLIEVLVDLELAKAIIYEEHRDTADALFEEQAQLIYKEHAIDASIFQKSYINYLNNPTRLEALYEQLIAKLEELLKEN